MNNRKIVETEETPGRIAKPEIKLIFSDFNQVRYRY
jgi:hypothetical protein